MATYYVDTINGKNRTTVTNAVASNPSGSTVLITFPPTGSKHEYITGMQVVLTYFTAWLNTTWTITVVDDYSFTLDGAVWQVTADVTGASSPAVGHLGGDTWATAWRTLSSIVNRVAGDIIKVAKTPDPIYLGECDWSSDTQVIIPSGLVKMIDDCEIAWIGSPSVVSTAITGSYPKFGTKKASFNIATAFTTGKIAYRTLPATLDLSDYQRITFWATFSKTLEPNYVRICLCSDNIGDVIVDSFTINELQMSTNNRYITLTKEGGGNLSSAINSIAIYTDVDITMTITLDHILACKTNNIHLGSLISLNSNAQGGSEPWHCIRAIDNNILYFDSSNNLLGAKNDRTFALPQATFIRETSRSRQVSSSSATEHVIGFSGIANETTGLLYAEIQGGYNTVTDVCDGETLLDGQNYGGNNLNTGPGRRLVKISHIGCFRYFIGYAITNSSFITVKDVFVSANGSASISCSTSSDMVFDNIIGGSHNSGLLNISSCLRVTTYNLRESFAHSNHHINIVNSFDIRIQFASYMMSTGSRCLQVGVSCENIVLYDSVYYRLTDVASFPSGNTSKLQVYNLNILQTSEIMNMVYYGAVATLTKFSVGNTYDTWKFSSNSSLLYNAKLAPIAFNANQLVTVTLSVRTHTSYTLFSGRMKIARHDSFGISQQIINIPANSEFNDIFLQFTPTVAGVVDLELECAGTFYFENLRVVQ